MKTTVQVKAGTIKHLVAQIEWVAHWTKMLERGNPVHPATIVSMENSLRLAAKLLKKQLKSVS